VRFELRDFREEDFEALWQIDQQCFAPEIAYSQRELSAYIRRGGSFTLVAQPASAEGHTPSGRRELAGGSSSTVVGFIIAEANRRQIGHIISIDVLPAFRRSGLGSKLLFEAENRLERVQCRAVVLETAVNNGAALAFYKRHQYQIVKIIPHYYLTGVDAFVLEKKL
jgi:[ribosomal protein S18]-alanine N-acetyltransferase